uniref:Uncharacterized protein n=1 Tax=Glossina palpalis gambiensis TaxID=67801 RepID=A0A1B0BVU2_9MUSC
MTKALKIKLDMHTLLSKNEKKKSTLSYVKVASVQLAFLLILVQLVVVVLVAFGTISHELQFMGLKTLSRDCHFVASLEHGYVLYSNVFNSFWRIGFTKGFRPLGICNALRLCKGFYENSISGSNLRNINDKKDTANINNISDPELNYHTAEKLPVYGTKQIKNQNYVAKRRKKNTKLTIPPTNPFGGIIKPKN